MSKYDEHGFYTREWAEQNIPGFTELGTCCQQEVLLFPDVSVPCLASLELDIPAPVIPAFSPESFNKPRHHGPGVLLVGGGGGGYNPPKSVPEPATGLLLLVLLLGMVALRRWK